MSEHHDNQSKQTRRSVLKRIGAASAVSSFSLAGVPLVQGTSVGEKVGETNFATVSLTYREAPSYPLQHTDDFAKVIVNPSEKYMKVADFIAEQEAEEIMQKDVIISNRLITFPQDTLQENILLDIYSAEWTNELPVTASSQLLTEDKHLIPQVKAIFDADQLRVVVGGKTLTLPSEKTESVHLEPVEVLVSELTDDLVSVPDPVTGKSMLVKDEIVKSVSLKPVVDIANFGKLDVLQEVN